MKQDEDSERRHDLIRKAGWYSLVFMAAGVSVAVAGAALVALLLRFAGLPFLRTWGILTGLVIVAALTAVVVQSRRGQ